MPDPDDLDSALADGIITPEQAKAIRARRTAGTAPAADAASEEPFRLVSNFGDVFLCLGLLILYWSATGFLRVAGLDPLLIYGGFAVLFWVLAEFFVFGAKKKFPAVVSILLFVWMLYKAATLFLGIGQAGLLEMALGRAELAHLGILTGGLALALLRFRQPITVLALGLAGTLLVFTLARMYMAETPARLVLMACGIAMLCLGVLLDWQDRARTGIRHEWALWLFVLGSPLTVHPLFVGIIGDEIAEAQPRSLEGLMSLDLSGVVWIVAALALGFSLLGLLLDRRSLVASTLLYLSGVLTYASVQNGVGLTLSLGIVPLTLGILVILLGAGWTHIRRALLAIIPFRGLFRPAS